MLDKVGSGFFSFFRRASCSISLERMHGTSCSRWSLQYFDRVPGFRVQPVTSWMFELWSNLTPALTAAQIGRWAFCPPSIMMTDPQPGISHRWLLQRCLNLSCISYIFSAIALSTSADIGPSILYLCLSSSVLYVNQPSLTLFSQSFSLSHNSSRASMQLIVYFSKSFEIWKWYENLQAPFIQQPQFEGCWLWGN